MASDLLKRKAEEQAQKIEKQYGEGTYGSTSYLRKLDESPSTDSGGAKNSKVSDILEQRVAERSLDSIRKYNTDGRRVGNQGRDYRTVLKNVGDNAEAKAIQVENLKNELSAKKIKYTDAYWQSVHDEAVSSFRKEGKWDSVKIENRAWAEVDEQRRAWEKEKEELEKQIRQLSGVRDANWYDATIGSFKRGYQQSRFGDESFDKIWGLENEADDINKILQSDEYQFAADGYAKEGVSGALEMLGQRAYLYSKPKTYQTVGASTLAGAGAAFVAGQAGPQVLSPEEAVTVPAGALLGFKTGMALASAENALRIESGHAYNEMLENGISHEAAKEISLAVGAVNASLEFVQTKKLVDAFKILNKSGATTTVAKKILDELVERGIDVAVETAQEVAQEGVTMGGVEAAHRIDKGEGLYTWGDVGERLGDTAKSSALAFGMMNVPATVTNIATTKQGETVRKKQPTGEERKAEEIFHKQVTEEYNKSVDKKILSFAKFARQNKGDNTSKLTLSGVNDRAVNDIKNLTGIDVSGYNHSLKANTVRHIDERHGAQGSADSSMADDNDLARIQYVLDNYDSVERLDDVSKEYRDKKQQPAPVIRYTKRVNGSYYVVEAVPDTKRQELPIVSVYKNKAVEQQTRDVQAPTRNVRNDSAGTTLSTNNISQQSGTVKESGVSVLQRVEALTKNGEKITEQEAKAASGYGDYGAKVLTNFVNNAKGQTFSQVKSDMHLAYLAGLANKDMKPQTDLQREAYFAGKQDRAMSKVVAAGKTLKRDKAINSTFESVATPTNTVPAFEEIDNFRKATEAKILQDKDNNIGGDAIDLSNDKDLSTRIDNQRGSKKYKIIRDYILETIGGGPIVLSDGIVAKVDRSDALHLANRSANRKIAYISKIKSIVEKAKLCATDDKVEHNKFDEFRYYQAKVKYEDETYPVYLNVGRSKNGDGYHIYDITRKIGAIAKQKDALERVKIDLRSEIDSPITKEIVSQPQQSVKSDLSYKDDADMFQEADDSKLAMWTTNRVGNKVKPKSISEIVATVEHEFGINITTGHIRGKGVLGQYNKNNRGIRTKIANNLPVISHELGHYFERTLDIKSKLNDEMLNELTAQLDAKFAENYIGEQIVREGIAEYVRRFLQNRESAAIDYPKFNDFFLKLFPSKDLAKLQQLADDINAYYSLDADTATNSIKLSEEGAVDLRTPMEKLKEKASSLYQAFYDSNHAIKRFDRATGSNAYIMARNAAYSDAIAGQIVTGDLTDKNGKYISSGLKTVLHGIDINNKDEYRLFGEYLTVKHGPERLKEGMRVFADDRKNSTNWMENRQSQLEAQYPQFKKASERLYTFIKQFYKTWGVETGLISEKTLENWSERWEHYVPFNRVMEKGMGNFGAKRGFANQNSTIKKARGSGRDIKNPVDSIIENIVKMVNAGVRNDVMRTITTSAERLGADATFLEQVPMPMIAAKMDMTGVKDTLTAWLEESDLDDDSKDKASGLVNNLDNILLQYGRGKAFGNVVTVLNDGAPQAWKINDVELLQSLTSLSPKTMDGILDAYAVLSRFMTSNITGNNLVWSIFSNLPRDIGTFFTYSKNKNVVEMAKGVGSAYLNKFKGDKADPLYKEFLAMGGGKISAYTADRNLAKDVRQKLSNRKFNPNPLDLIGFVSDMVEAGPRFATYKMMREVGMTSQEAFYEAMDITVDFRRGGQISKEINKIVPFFNASLQGLDKFCRWITAEEVKGADRKKAVRNRAIAYVTVNAALAAISYAINNGDEEKEEDYEQLSTYIKNSYWVFPIDDGKYFAISKPRENGVLSSFFETCLEYSVGENDHAFDEFYAYATENFLPAIANDIVQIGSKGLVETGMNIIGSLGMVGVVGYLGANRDFLGRPIVSSGLQSLEKKDQYTDRTSKIAYWLGQAFNGSPEQIDYFLQQILGGWWKYQKALFPVGEKNRDWSLGVGNTYIKDNQYSTDLTNWLYDRADATAKSKKSNPLDIKKAIAAKWDSNMVNFYGAYYKKAKNNSQSTSARSTRQLVLDMIKEYQKGIDGDFKTSWQKAVEKVCKDKKSTEYMPSVMPAEVTDGNDKKHNLSDVQYVEYQTDYLRLYWEIVEETLTSGMTTSEKANTLTAAKKVAKERATERTLNRICAPPSKFTTKYEGVGNDILTKFLAGVSDVPDKKEEVVSVISGLDADDDVSWKLYLSKYDSKNAYYAKENGIRGNDYMYFLEALNEADKPSKNGEYGTYTQEEAYNAIKQLEGLSRQEKAALWQSVNTTWKAKNNPFR